MEKYGPQRDGKSRRSSGGYQDGPPSSYHTSSRSHREHPDRRHYDDLDDPNWVPTPDTLPPPLYTSAPEDLPDVPNRHDHDQRGDRRRNSYGSRTHSYDSGDRRGQDRDNGDRDQGWNGFRNRRDRDNRGDDFRGGRRYDQPPRPRGSFDGRSGDQDWRMNSSSNYNNNGGGRRRTQGSEGWGGPPSGPVQGSSFGGGGRNNSWGGSSQGGGGWGGGVGSGGSGDWRNVGNASAAPVQESWTTTPTPTPTPTTTDAPAGDWGGGWGTASASETNNETVDTSTAVATPTAWSATTVSDSWGAGATQSSSTTQSASNDSPPAPDPSDSWASGWSTQAQWNSAPSTSQPGQPSTAATGSDPWNIQGPSSDKEVTRNTQSSSNQAPSNWWGEIRQTPPQLTPKNLPPRAPSPGPAQTPMQLDSWPPPPVGISSKSPSHSKSSHRSPSSYSPTPVDGSRLSRSRSNSQSDSKATKDHSQAKRSRLYSKILPHCQRAIQRDSSIPAALKAIEASSLAVRLAVEKADVLDGLEEPALTTEMDKLLAAEKDGVNACSPPDVQSTSMVIAPKIPIDPQSAPVLVPVKPVTSNPGSKSVLLASSHPNPANSAAPVLPWIVPQPETMQVDSDDSAVLARWTCINQCSRATFAFSFNRSTREGNATIILVCRSPVGGAVDPYNEDGTWQVFTTIINRGTEREEAHLLPPLPQSSYRTSQDLSLDITENVQHGQNTVELKRMMLIGGLAGFTFEVKLIPA